MGHYSYVGPDEIRDSVSDVPPGRLMQAPEEVGAWLSDTKQKSDDWGLFVATFIINLEGWLCVADRHSEHIACAGGKAVLGAGEIFFERCGEQWEVAEISNQSTGFCPKLVSWHAVASALERIPLKHPGCFTREFLFRRCPSCSQCNIIKDDWFVCGVCDGELPKKWNFA